MSSHLAGVFDPDEITGQPYVIKIELGGFDQSLPNIGVKRWQLENDVTRFQHGEPLSRRRVEIPRRRPPRN